MQDHSTTDASPVRNGQREYVAVAIECAVMEEDGGPWYKLRYEGYQGTTWEKQADVGHEVILAFWMKKWPAYTKRMDAFQSRRTSNPRARAPKDPRLSLDPVTGDTVPHPILVTVTDLVEEATSKGWSLQEAAVVAMSRNSFPALTTHPE